MRVLVAFEFSGAVRDAFAARGHDAVSFDLHPSETPGHHYTGNITAMDREFFADFDLLIAHPPCTHLAISGARWFKDKKEEQEKALDLVRWVFALPIERKCIENPVSIIGTRIRPATQYIQPWQFGHGRTKKTGLWLENLPALQPTKVSPLRFDSIHMMPGNSHQAKNRSRTFPGVAAAMAEQWGSL